MRQCKLVPYPFRPKSVLPTLRLPSSAVAIDNLVYGMSGDVCLDYIYEQFPSMNEVDLTFENLCSIEKFIKILIRKIDSQDIECKVAH